MSRLEDLYACIFTGNAEDYDKIYYQTYHTSSHVSSVRVLKRPVVNKNSSKADELD